MQQTDPNLCEVNPVHTLKPQPFSHNIFQSFLCVLRLEHWVPT
jgi:hypothetical protein